MDFCETPNMQLVDDRLRPRHGVAVASARPLERGIGHRAFRNKWSAVTLVEREIIHGFHLVTENCRIPNQLADMGLGVRIEEELVWVKPKALIRLIGAVNAVAVGGAGPNPGQVSMPSLIGVLWQGHTLHFLLA